MRLVLVFLLLIGVCFAARYAIYVQRPVSPSEQSALEQVSEVVSDTGANSLWATGENASLLAINNVIDSAFSVKRNVFGNSDVLIDTIKPVEKTALPSWGLGRIVQRNLPLPSTYAFDRTGTGTTIWVIDTGIDTTHTDFGGRATMVFSTYSPSTDCDGHGTHVSGTAAGTTYGVAKLATLKGVKVLDCNGAGTTLTVAQGLQFVLSNLAASKNVINMSFGYGSRDSVIEALLQSLYDAGVTMAAAAGNNNGNACNHFPSAHTTVISVAASTSSDARASFSNWGSCVALFAPGQSIVSDLLGGGSTTLSGTSMASPHVAGAAALALQNGQLSPASVKANLLGRATQNKITSASGSPNYLLFALQDTNPPQSNPTTTTTTSSSSSSSSSTTSNDAGRASLCTAVIVGVAVAWALN
jgi:subtilisin family serine protease